MLDADEGFERLHAELRHREAHGEPEPPVVDPTVVTWLHEPGGFAPLARLTAADAISVVCDHVGAPLVTLAADGRTLASFTLDSYGNATTTGDHAELIPHHFPGQWADPETGLHYNRFRHYDPGSGQYLSRDPIGLRGGLQPMAYVDDPSGWVDPLGLAGKPAAGAGCDGEAAGGGDRRRSRQRKPGRPILGRRRRSMERSMSIRAEIRFRRLRAGRSRDRRMVGSCRLEMPQVTQQGSA